MIDGRLTVGRLKIEIHGSTWASGQAAANQAAKLLRQLSLQRENIGVVFATGASQLATLEALVAIDDLPWQKVTGLHLDEYVGIGPENPGSFGHYLRQYLTSRVRMKEFYGIDGNTDDPAKVCAEYAERLHSTQPQLCLMGVGENGHLAFNDPGVADFCDPRDVKLVELDRVCREQQAAEGWFPNMDAVPMQALTLTISAMMRIPHLIASVPGKRKSAIVRRTLEDPISTACPATILRDHRDATLYLDADSAEEWERSEAALRPAGPAGSRGL